MCFVPLITVYQTKLNIFSQKHYIPLFSKKDKEMNKDAFTPVEVKQLT